MNFIKRETQPMDLRIGGVAYPAIYNFAAIAELENYSETPHHYALIRLNAGVPTAKELIGLVYGMLKTAGAKSMKNGKQVPLLIEDVEASLNPAEEKELIEQIKTIIEAHSPAPKEAEKN